MSKTILNYESLVHATAAATGSIVTMSIFYPLDLIKFRKQINDCNLVNRSTLDAIIYILKNEGILALYRGLTPVIITMATSNFVYFYTFHGLKSLKSKGLGNPKRDLLISILAGVVNVLTTNPLWVVNNRLKVNENLNFTGLLDGMVQIFSTEGLSALWKGVGPSLLLVSNPAIHFTIYEALKRRVTVKSATTFFFISALSKTIATLVTYPLQLAQTRQRLAKGRRINTVALLLAIIKKNGPQGLYRGMETKILQTVLSTAVMFVAYEKIVEYVFKLLLGSNRRR